jgi:hypothetical protein
MPSFSRRLMAEFDAEFARLANEWYLKWHNLARGEAIDVEDFRGGRIQMRDMRFDGAAEIAYWNAVERYASAKITEVFLRAESEIRARGGVRAAAIAEDASISVRSHLERLHRHAVFTECRLQERGYPDEKYLVSHRDDSIANEIQRRKTELLGRYRSIPWARRVAMVLEDSPRWSLIFFVLLIVMSAELWLLFSPV